MTLLTLTRSTSPPPTVPRTSAWSPLTVAVMVMDGGVRSMEKAAAADELWPRASVAAAASVYAPSAVMGVPSADGARGADGGAVGGIEADHAQRRGVDGEGDAALVGDVAGAVARRDAQRVRAVGAHGVAGEVRRAVERRGEHRRRVGVDRA